HPPGPARPRRRGAGDARLGPLAARHRRARADVSRARTRTAATGATASAIPAPSSSSAPLAYDRGAARRGSAHGKIARQTTLTRRDVKQRVEVAPVVGARVLVEEGDQAPGSVL